MVVAISRCSLIVLLMFIFLCACSNKSEVEPVVAQNTTNNENTGSDGVSDGKTDVSVDSRPPTFFEICAAGTLQEVEAELKKGVSPEDRDEAQRTGLMVAAGSTQDRRIIELLIASGFDVNAHDSTGWTPLLEAAALNEEPTILTTLVALGADTSAVLEDGETLLMVAAGRNPNVDIANLVLEMGVSVNVSTGSGATALTYALGGNPNVQVAELLLAAGADPKNRDINGDSILHSAAGNPKMTVLMIRKLLALGFSPNQTNQYNETPLVRAARADVMKLLIDSGADIARYGTMAMYRAMESSNSVDLVRTLVEAQVRVGSDGAGPELFHKASVTNQPPELFRLLLKAGAKINEPGLDGTPLMMASRFNDNSAVIKLLIDSGADAKAATPQGVTTLHIASLAAKDALSIKYLIEAGGEVQARDKSNGETPLMFAARNPNGAPIVRALLAAGAKVNDQSTIGTTALLEAASNPNLDVLKALIDAGAEVRHADKKGWTALMYATFGEGRDLKTPILIRAGANPKDIDEAMSRGDPFGM